MKKNLKNLSFIQIILLFLSFMYLLKPCYCSNFTDISDEIISKASRLGIEGDDLLSRLEKVVILEAKISQLKMRLKKIKKWNEVKSEFNKYSYLTYKEELIRIITEIDEATYKDFYERLDNAISWLAILEMNLRLMCPPWIKSYNFESMAEEFIKTLELTQIASDFFEEKKQKYLEEAIDSKEQATLNNDSFHTKYYSGIIEYIKGDFYLSYTFLKEAKKIIDDNNVNEDEIPLGTIEILQNQLITLESYFLQEVRSSLNRFLLYAMNMDSIESNHIENGRNLSPGKRTFISKEIFHHLNSENSDLFVEYPKISFNDEPIVVEKVRHILDEVKKYDSYYDSWKTQINKANVNIIEIAQKACKGNKKVVTKAILELVRVNLGLIIESESTWSKISTTTKKLSIGSLKASVETLKDILQKQISKEEQKLPIDKKRELWFSSKVDANKFFEPYEASEKASVLRAYKSAYAADIYSDNIFSLVVNDLSAQGFEETDYVTKQHIITAIALAQKVKKTKLFQDTYHFSVNTGKSALKLAKAIAIEGITFYIGGIFAKGSISLGLKLLSKYRLIKASSIVRKQSLVKAIAFSAINLPVYAFFFTGAKIPFDFMIEQKPFINISHEFPKYYKKYFEMFLIGGVIGFGFTHSLGKAMHSSSLFANNSTLIHATKLSRQSGKLYIEKALVSELERYGKRVKEILFIGAQATGFELFHVLKEKIKTGYWNFDDFGKHLLSNFVNFYALHMSTATIARLVEGPKESLKLSREIEIPEIEVRAEQNPVDVLFEAESQRALGQNGVDAAPFLIEGTRPGYKNRTTDDALIPPDYAQAKPKDNDTSTLAYAEKARAKLGLQRKIADLNDKETLILEPQKDGSFIEVAKQDPNNSILITRQNKFKFTLINNSNLYLFIKYKDNWIPIEKGIKIDILSNDLIALAKRGSVEPVLAEALIISNALARNYKPSLKISSRHGYNEGARVQERGFGQIFTVDGNEGTFQANTQPGTFNSRSFSSIGKPKGRKTENEDGIGAVVRLENGVESLDIVSIDAMGKYQEARLAMQIALSESTSQLASNKTSFEIWKSVLEQYDLRFDPTLPDRHLTGVCLVHGRFQASPDGSKTLDLSWFGDTGAVIFRPDPANPKKAKILFETIDSSIENALATGEIKLSDLPVKNRENLIRNAVLNPLSLAHGIRGITFHRIYDLQKGDIAIFGSDGLRKFLSSAEVWTLIRDCKSPEEMIYILRSAVSRTMQFEVFLNGHGDNVNIGAVIVN
ncbi:MAG: hypothetical protein ABIA04_02210 [Pseudomonadota bacterium]